MSSAASPSAAIPLTAPAHSRPEATSALRDRVAAAKLHAIYQIVNAPIRDYPFPHICVEGVFPEPFFEEILAHLPANDGYTPLRDTDRVTGAYSGARLALFPDMLDQAKLPQAQKKFWAAMFEAFGDNEFGNAVLKKFGAFIEQRFAGKKTGAQRLKARSEVFMMRDLVTYSLGPHTDNDKKLVSMLFYLPPDNAHPERGTSVYLPKDREFSCPGGPHHRRELFDLVATMPYHRNTVVAFPKTKGCFHGVETLVPDDSRRDIFFFDLKGRLI